MPPINVQPAVFATVVRQGQEFGLTQLLPFQPGVTEEIVIRLRNANPVCMTAMGSLQIIPNGHGVAPQVVWGEGSVDNDGSMVGPSLMRENGRAMPEIMGALIANFVVPCGRYLEVRLACTWINSAMLPQIYIRAESTTAGVPVFRIEETPAGGITALGMMNPVAGGPTPAPTT